MATFDFTGFGYNPTTANNSVLEEGIKLAIQGRGLFVNYVVVSDSAAGNKVITLRVESNQTVQNVAAIVGYAANIYFNSHDISVQGMPIRSIADLRQLDDRILTGNNSTLPNIANGTYKVIAGDTLSKIGNKLKVNWQDIARLNNISAPYIINIGQELKIPSSTPVITNANPTPNGTINVNTTNIPNPPNPQASSDFFKKFATSLGISTGVLAVAGLAILIVVAKK